MFSACGVITLTTDFGPQGPFVATMKGRILARLPEARGVFIDTGRLQPGYKYNEMLAQAICQSVCMVVVYSPKYERHEYCVREYEAMVKLEGARRQLLGSAGMGQGFIIPVILRGSDNIPQRIRDHVHYAEGVDVEVFGPWKIEVAK